MLIPSADGHQQAADLELTILMPCLNEGETVDACVTKALGYLRRASIDGEVLIADNGSTDGSQAIARRRGARVVDVPVRGYGAALKHGIEAARGRFVIMGDSDDSYDFSSLEAFVDELRRGSALVMGNRFRGGIEPGAMPALHRYLGNPVLSFVGRLFFQSPIRDFHCGLRGFDRSAIRALDLQTTGMEFASEMVVKATLKGLAVAEVPTKLYPDGRTRPPYLRSWRDGWRHLRFLLIYSPRWLFLVPGAVLAAFGLLVVAVLARGPLALGSVTFDVHTMLYGAVAVIVGIHAAILALFSKVFAVSARLLPDSRLTQFFIREATLERGLVVGGVLFLCGLLGAISAFLIWEAQGFGTLVPSAMMRLTIPSLMCVTVGAQIMFASFFLSVMRLPRGTPVG